MWLGLPYSSLVPCSTHAPVFTEDGRWHNLLYQQGTLSLHAKGCVLHHGKITQCQVTTFRTLISASRLAVHCSWCHRFKHRCNLTQARNFG